MRMTYDNKLDEMISAAKREGNDSTIMEAITQLYRSINDGTLDSTNVTIPTQDSYRDGWIPIVVTSCSGDNELTLQAVVAADICIGDKLSYKDDGTQAYAYVIAKPTTTTITVKQADASGDLGTLTSGSVVTVPKMSKVENPVGHPVWFNYTHANIFFGAGSAGTYAQDVHKYKFRVVGGLCQIRVNLNITNAGSWTGDVLLRTPLSPTVTLNHNIGGVWLANSNTKWGEGGALTGVGTGHNYLKFSWAMNVSIFGWGDVVATAACAGDGYFSIV